MSNTNLPIGTTIGDSTPLTVDNHNGKYGGNPHPQYGLPVECPIFLQSPFVIYDKNTQNTCVRRIFNDYTEIEYAISPACSSLPTGDINPICILPSQYSISETIIAPAVLVSDQGRSIVYVVGYKGSQKLSAFRFPTNISSVTNLYVNIKLKCYK